MCGRYSISKPLSTVINTFKLKNIAGTYQPQYNAYPSQFLPLLTNEKPDTLQFYQWGLIPSWSKYFSINRGFTNARSETLLKKASFRSSFLHQRCLILSDGYYEWQQSSLGKIPYRITPKLGQLWAYAGLWAIWTKGSITHLTFTIITTSAKPSIAHIHHRMPVILPFDTHKQWLDNASSTALLQHLLQSSNEPMHYYTVSPSINKPQNNSADLINPYFYNQSPPLF